MSAATLPDLDAPYGILADSDPCDCICHIFEEEAAEAPCMFPAPLPVCENGCYPKDSDVPFTLDRWTCVGGTRYMLVDSRED